MDKRIIDPVDARDYFPPEPKNASYWKRRANELETQLAEEAEAHGVAMNDLARKHETDVNAFRLQLAKEGKARMESDRLYERECQLHDAKKAECLRLDKMLRECEEREEYVPLHTETISVIVNILIYGLVFAAALKYLFWG